jgi:hypothetical protein
MLLTMQAAVFRLYAPPFLVLKLHSAADSIQKLLYALGENLTVSYAM